MAVAVAGCGSPTREARVVELPRSQQQPTPVVTGYATPAPAAPQATTVMNFPDIPLPRPNSIDVDRTMMLGTASYWFGRVSLATPMTVNETYEFYRREMPPLGWNEITSVRSTNSVLSFQMDDRIATIQLSNAPSGGSQVEFWVNPRTAPPSLPPPPGLEPSAEVPPQQGLRRDNDSLPALR